MDSTITIRKGVSILLAVFLYKAAIPFQPITWLIRDEAGYFLDRFVAGVILIGACYFQWRIASLTRPLLISGPSVGTATTMRNGRLERGPAAGAELFVWNPDEMFWLYAAGEAGLLAVAHYGASEVLRRLIVCGVIAFSWLVGWYATPQSTKQWAWGHIKSAWIWMLLWEVMGISSRGGPRRRARW